MNRQRNSGNRASSAGRRDVQPRGGSLACLLHLEAHKGIDDRSENSIMRLGDLTLDEDSHEVAKPVSASTYDLGHDAGLLKIATRHRCG